MNQLFVLLVLVKRNNRDSVLQMVQIRVSCIVHQKDVLKIPILDDSQILDIDSFLGLPALRTEQAMTHQLSLWIKMVQDNIGVAFMTGCKDYNLTELREFFEELHGVGTDIDSGIDFLSSGELDLEGDVMRDAEVFIAMDESFIEVENQGVLD